MVCNWPHGIMTSSKSTDFQGREQEVTLTHVQKFSISIAIWEFHRVFPPFCPTPLLSNLVGTRSLFICFISPNTNFACMCPLFKMQSPQVFNLPFEITDTQSEKGGHLRMEEFYFRLIFFARTVVRLSKGQYLHRQS